jgi:type IV secretion system protein VirB10
MASDDDKMNPDYSPGEVTKKSGVRKVNRVPLYIIGALSIVFIIIMMVVANERAAAQKEVSEETKHYVGSTETFANEVTARHVEGIIPAEPVEKTENKALGEPVNQAEVVLPTEEELNQPPPPPRLPNPNGNGYEASQEDQVKERIRQAKLQMLERAINAKTEVTVQIPQGGLSGGAGTLLPGDASREEMLAEIERVKQYASSTRDSDPTAAYKAQLAKVQADLGMNSSDSEAPSTNAFGLAAANSPSTAEGDRWKLEGKIATPSTPYELRAGSVIPGVTITGINSEVPGQILAQVAQNVYDTATGKFLLIPQGARLVGQYGSSPSFGQSRLIVAWQRIVFPDGKALDVGEMPGADGSGYSGFHDKVNNHYFRTFASAILMSAVVAGVNISQDQGGVGQNGSSQRAGDAMSEALGQQLGEVTAQMISKNLNIAPTLTIRPGYLFNVTATKDITFTKPYQSFDY